MVTPVPEVIQSLPPVTIRHIMEGPNPWLAFLGTVAISFIALVVALITLSRVNRQIKIANKQIDLANRQITLSTEQLLLATDQLGVAREELRLVTEDLALATEMNALARRAPQLTLKWRYLSESNQLFEGTRHYYREVLIAIGIPNSGTKVARDVTAELLFPITTLFESPDVKRRVVGGETYIRYDAAEEPLRIAVDNHFERTFRLRVRPGLTKLTFLWRIYDDEYAYPTSEWGRETIELKLPPIT